MRPLIQEIQTAHTPELPAKTFRQPVRGIFCVAKSRTHGSFSP